LRWRTSSPVLAIVLPSQTALALVEQGQSVPAEAPSVQLTPRAPCYPQAYFQDQCEACREGAVFRRVYEPPPRPCPLKLLCPPPRGHCGVTCRRDPRPSPVFDQPDVRDTGDQRGVSTPADESGARDSTPPPRIEQAPDDSVPTPPVVHVPLVPPATTAPSVAAPESPTTQAAPVAVAGTPPSEQVPRYHPRERKTPRIAESMKPKSRTTASLLASQHPRRATALPRVLDSLPAARHAMLSLCTRRTSSCRPPT